MSVRTLDEHLRYWQDDVKLARYRAALRDLVRPGDRVLDLGSGTGLLGLLACDAGAGHVIAVESGPIAEVLARIVETNGYADRIEVVQGRSTDLTLDRRVDVLVGDQLGGFAYSSGVFRFYADAAERLLEPGGVAIPAGIDLLLAPAEHEPSRLAIDGFRSHARGYDLTPLHDLARNTLRTIELQTAGCLLAPAQVVRRTASTDGSPFSVTTEFVIDRAGRLDGLAGMFVAWLAPNVRVTNVPGDEDRLQTRWQDLFPLTTPIEVRPGDRVVVEVTVNPTTYLATWRVGLGDLDRAARHATFLGQLIDSRTLARLTKRGVDLGPAQRAVVRAIADGDEDTLHPSQLVARLTTQHPDVPAATFARLVERTLEALGGHVTRSSWQR